MTPNELHTRDICQASIQAEIATRAALGATPDQTTPDAARKVVAQRDLASGLLQAAELQAAQALAAYDNLGTTADLQEAIIGHVRRALVVGNGETTREAALRVVAERDKARKEAWTASEALRELRDGPRTPRPQVLEGIVKGVRKTLGAQFGELSEDAAIRVVAERSEAFKKVEALTYERDCMDARRHDAVQARDVLEKYRDNVKSRIAEALRDLG